MYLRAVVAGLVFAIAIVLPPVSSLSEAPVPGQPKDSDSVFELLLLPGQASYARGSDIDLTILLQNTGTTAVVVYDRDFVFAVQDFVTGAPLIEGETSFLEATSVEIQGGGTIPLVSRWPLWQASVENGSAPQAVWIHVEHLASGASAAVAIALTVDVASPTPDAPPVLTADEKGGANLFSPSSTGGSVGYNFRTGTRWESDTTGWRYNENGKPAYLPSQEDAIWLGFQAWEDDLGSSFDFVYHGFTTASTPVNDGNNVVSWRSGFLDITTWAAVQCWTNSGKVVECDMTFNSNLQWSNSGEAGKGDVRTIATHEAGHFLRLRDIYNPGDIGYQSWMGTNNDAQILYGKYSAGTIDYSLDWGDQSGTRYAYPNRPAGVGTLYSTTEGLGSGITDIDGNGAWDMLSIWSNDYWGGNEFRLAWAMDLSWASGTPGYWTTTYSAFSGVGDHTDGVGADAAYLGQNAAPDLFVAWIDDPPNDNTIWYKIGWDVNSLGYPNSWTSSLSVGSAQGYNQQGLGACITSLNGNSLPDVVLAWVDNPPGPNTLKYQIGLDLLVSSWSWGPVYTVPTPWVGDETDGAGLACGNVDESGSADYILSWADDAGDNTAYYVVGYNPDTSGVVGSSSWSTLKKAPGRGIGSWQGGLAASAMELDGQGAPEIAFAWVNDAPGDDQVFMEIEWNSRIMSHDA